ncbi:unnamed protein product [Dicrocoelium dendriticum]|nr:unnamed protein product [Dicrocoelium dendriticum]
MDEVLKCVLASELSGEIKQKILRNCLVYLKNEADMKDALDLGVVCLRYLHSLADPKQTYRYELECICREIISQLSDSDVDCMIDKLKLAFATDVSSFNLHSVDYAIDYARTIHEAGKLICLVRQLETHSVDIVDGITSVLRIFNRLPLVSPFVELNEIKQELSIIWSSIYLIDGLRREQSDALTTGLLLFLAHLGCHDGAKGTFIFDTVSALSYRASEALLHIMSIKAYNEDGEVSACDEGKLAAFLKIFVDKFLIIPVSAETCYLPLASFLFCLDSSTSSSDENVAMLSSFVESVVDNHVHSADECVAIIKRLIVWLMWPGTDLHQSPLDKWIISFICHYSYRLHSANGLRSSPPAPWLHFIVDQLRFVLSILCEQWLPSTAVLNTLSFLLLAGNPTISDPRYILIKNELLPTLCSILEKFKGRIPIEEEEFVLRRLSSVMQLLAASLRKVDNNSVLLVSDSFGNAIRSFFKQTNTLVNSPVSEKGASEHLAVYSWPTLLRWGSKAGTNLRRCWAKWDKISYGIRSDQLLTRRIAATSDEHRANDYRGLVNIGNTCYANAALQLLYHCPDFRLALLGSDIPSPPVSSAACPLLERTAAHSASPTCDLDAPAASTCVYRGSYAPRKEVGLLHSQLFFLFRALNTSQGPAVGDLGAVLTLSKPEHFVNGEQQDASEYLNHLLDRLHEEELGLNNSRSISGNDFRSLSPHSSQSPCQTTDAQTTFVSTSTDTDHLSNSSAPSATQPNVSSYYVDSVGQNSSTNSGSSLVHRLFGGQLVHHTSCTECAHVSSTRYEHFSLLYLPVASTEEITLESEQKQAGSSYAMEQDARASHADLDLTSLIRTHFTQIEYVPTQEQCESCGKVAKRARRLSLRHLASHVFICLNVFTYCRSKQSGSKISHRIAIPERLSVTFSEHNNTSTDANVSTVPQSGDEHPQAVTSRSYALHGMILHHGMSISCGHYTCVTRVGMQWIWFDDDTARYTTLEQVYSKPMTTPYLLLYIQV